ncbi:MAG: ABC transporter ATP-binding protein [Desulforhopalus sp.]
MNPPILSVNNLCVSFSTLRGDVNVIDNLNFSIGPGEILGIVGESGSGKSVTALAIMQLLGQNGNISQGSVNLADKEISSLDEEGMLQVRGVELAMIFQEPMTSLNPVYTVGFQIAETLIEHLNYSPPQAMEEAVHLMEQVGIPDAGARVTEYPHQMSGGMRQRVMIAMGLACKPKFLIADEPTTALDVTIQAQILRLLMKLRDEMNMGIMLITHDMGVIAEIADQVMVMYCGQAVESASVSDIFNQPRHPYTRLLLNSIPLVIEKKDRLDTIEGNVSTPANYVSGCRFSPRCPLAIDACRQSSIPIKEIMPGRKVRCIRVDETELIDRLGV